MNLQTTPRSATGNGRTANTPHYGTLGEQAFQRMISLEGRRANRSRKSFLLMLIDLCDHNYVINKNSLVGSQILAALSTITRETDVTGWYRERSVVGVLFTEVAVEELSSVTAAIMTRVSQALRRRLTPQQFSDVNLSFRVLPDGQQQFSKRTVYSTVYPTVTHSGSLTESSL